MDDNFTVSFSETPTPSGPEVVAEYKFVITFETYPDDEMFSENYEQKVMYEIERALARDFANEVEFLFSGMVQVRIGSLERGSILGSIALVLAGTVKAVDFFSKYKDFYDSLVLLRSQLRSVLNRVLNRIVPQHVSHTVNITFVPGPVTRAAPVSQARPTITSTWYSRAFFIYLIVSNIFLTIIVVTLVYRAVAAMYFNAP